jgi:phospholipase/carboxylesterase
MHTKQIVTAGRKIGESSKLMIMLHGRGADAEDILGLSDQFSLDDFTLLAPQATNNTWYPYSFMAPVLSNEPWLSSALENLKELIADLESKGYKRDQIYILGFSQGACLSLEFVARNASRFGGVIAFTGGLIGDQLNLDNYKGDFAGTPIFIGTSDPDPHVPVARVKDSIRILESMNAAVTSRIYRGMGHTINADEIAEAKKILLE